MKATGGAGLAFPNSCRSFDERLERVRFWGHDSAIEISFYVERDALQKLSPAIAAADPEPAVAGRAMAHAGPAMAHAGPAMAAIGAATTDSETGCLAIFDATVERIHAVAERLYRRGDKGTYAYVLSAEDF